MNRRHDHDALHEDHELDVQLDRMGDEPSAAHGNRHRRQARQREAAARAPVGPTLELSIECSKQEYDWLSSTLGPLIADGVLTDVLFRVKGGKEATVYCCQAGPSTGWDLVAAKIYRPPSHRTMRNDWLYRQGRGVTNEGKTVRDDRTLRAIENRTDFGKGVMRGSWIRHEFDTMLELHRSGVHLPRPLENAGQVILMGFVGTRDGGAPTLHEVSLDRTRSLRVLEQLLDDVRRMLSGHVIHADLSAHNVLYDGQTGWIIDLPQAVDPIANPAALELLVRDCHHLCEYFARAGVTIDGRAVALDLWDRYQRGAL